MAAVYRRGEDRQLHGMIEAPPYSEGGVVIADHRHRHGQHSVARQHPDKLEKYNYR